MRECLREVRLAEQEGADWLMVKPGLPYADVVRAVSEISGNSVERAGRSPARSARALLRPSAASTSAP